MKHYEFEGNISEHPLSQEAYEAFEEIIAGLATSIDCTTTIPHLMPPNRRAQYDLGSYIRSIRFNSLESKAAYDTIFALERPSFRHLNRDAVKDPEILNELACLRFLTPSKKKLFSILKVDDPYVYVDPAYWVPLAKNHLLKLNLEILNAPATISTEQKEFEPYFNFSAQVTVATKILRKKQEYPFHS